MRSLAAPDLLAASYHSSDALPPTSKYSPEQAFRPHVIWGRWMPDDRALSRAVFAPGYGIVLASLHRCMCPLSHRVHQLETLRQNTQRRLQDATTTFIRCG